MEAEGPSSCLKLIILWLILLFNCVTTNWSSDASTRVRTRHTLTLCRYSVKCINTHTHTSESLLAVLEAVWLSFSVWSCSVGVSLTALLCMFTSSQQSRTQLSLCVMKAAWCHGLLLLIDSRCHSDTLNMMKYFLSRKEQTVKNWLWW